MITDDSAEKALRYLASTDEQLGELVGQVKGLEHRMKTEKAIAFLQHSGTVAEREAAALTGIEYLAMVDKYETAVTEMEIIRAKRKTRELGIEVWRSQNSNRRQAGQV